MQRELTILHLGKKLNKKIYKNLLLFTVVQSVTVRPSLRFVLFRFLFFHPHETEYYDFFSSHPHTLAVRGLPKIVVDFVKNDSGKRALADHMHLTGSGWGKIGTLRDGDAVEWRETHTELMVGYTRALTFFRGMLRICTVISGLKTEKQCAWKQDRGAQAGRQGWRRTRGAWRDRWRGFEVRRQREREREPCARAREERKKYIFEPSRCDSDKWRQPLYVTRVCFLLYIIYLSRSHFRTLRRIGLVSFSTFCYPYLPLLPTPILSSSIHLSVCPSFTVSSLKAEALVKNLV